jgi:hypothetical protein
MKLFLTTLLLLLLPVQSHACSLAPSTESIESFAKHADVIFTGTPIEIGKRYPKVIASKDVIEINQEYFRAPYEVIFDVETQWKGTYGKRIYVIDDGTNCGHNLRNRLEEPMLVFGKFDEVGLRIMQASSPKVRQMNRAEKTNMLNLLFLSER